MLNNKWQALEQFKPGGELAELFLDKLQQQTGWEVSFCRQAIVEYKKFLYLTTCSKNPVSPSTVVDKVWHLHLTFSRCYWEKLCPNILGYSLHHEPAMPTERHTTRNQYFDTLALYRKHFAQEPPKRFWPGSKSHQAVDQPRRIFPKVAILASAFMVIAAAASTNQTSSDLGISSWFIGLGVIALIIFLLARISTSNNSKGNGTCSGGYSGGNSSGGDASCGGGCGGCGG